MDSCQSLAAVVVMYNCTCAQSPTCRGLSALRKAGLQVLIYDNSTRDMGIPKECESLGWHYLGGTGNVGLSCAYNRCTAFLRQHLPHTEYLTLWDDDTEISPDYFSVLLQSIRERPADIFLPLITSAGRLLSPCLLTSGYLTRTFSTGEEALAYRGDRITGINSGMAAALSVFQDYRYDEHIFLDGVDHHFLRDQHSRGKTIGVIPYVCSHAFSGDSRPSVESALSRFSIFCRDYGYILRSRPVSRFLLLGKRCLRLTLQYKTAGFLKCLFAK